MMKRRVYILSALALLAPLSVHAQSTFHGIWQVEKGSVRVSYPQSFVLSDGMFRCDSCSPAFSIPADGHYHPMYADPAKGSEAVRIMNERTVTITEARNNKVVSTFTRTVSADGRTATVTFDDRTGAVPVSGSYVEERVGEAPEGAHAVSGTWRLADYRGAPNSNQVFSLALSGGRLRMTDPAGRSYDAPTNGTEAVYRGGGGIGSVTVEKVGLHRLRVTTRSDGRVVGVTMLNMLPDGQTMKIDQHNGRADYRMSYVAVRQSVPSFGSAGSVNTCRFTSGCRQGH